MVICRPALMLLTCVSWLSRAIVVTTMDGWPPSCLRDRLSVSYLMSAVDGMHVVSRRLLTGQVKTKQLMCAGSSEVQHRRSTTGACAGPMYPLEPFSARDR